MTAAEGLALMLVAFLRLLAEALMTAGDLPPAEAQGALVELTGQVEAQIAAAEAVLAA